MNKKGKVKFPLPFGERGRILVHREILEILLQRRCSVKQPNAFGRAFLKFLFLTMKDSAEWRWEADGAVFLFLRVFKERVKRDDAK